MISMIGPNNDHSLVGLSGGPFEIDKELWQEKENGNNQRHRDFISK